MAYVTEYEVQHYTVYAKVGQIKVNNNKVMCHLSKKLSDTFDQNPAYTLTKLGKTFSDEKRSQGLTFRANVKVIAKMKRQCPREK